MEKILFVTIIKEGETVNAKTNDSILANMHPADGKALVEENKNETYFEYLKTLGADLYDYVCLVPNGSELSTGYREIIREYLEGNHKGVVYLPLTILISEEIKGVLNTCVWKYNSSEDYGFLTHDLAKKQIDTTLFGALISSDLFLDPTHYDTGLSYYQHFRFLNSITAQEDVDVLGVPKTLVTLNYDLSHKGVDEKVKVENYKRAVEPFTSKKEELVVTVEETTTNL